MQRRKGGRNKSHVIRRSVLCVLIKVEVTSLSVTFRLYALEFLFASLTLASRTVANRLDAVRL